MQSLTAYIKNPGLIDAAALSELEELVERYPAFQAARLLRLRGLYQLQDERFGQELSRAAIFMPDRQRLFELFESDVLQAAIAADTAAPTSEGGKHESQPTDRTLALIDTFLGAQPQQPKPRKPRPHEATVDYTAYLLQLDDVQPEDISTPATASSTEARQPQTQSMAATAPTAETQDGSPLAPAVQTPVSDTAASSVDDIDDDEQQTDTSDTYFTETLARIYIKQGKYAKAIEIIRRISLLYPQKNRYFADQIRFLEKLLLNESHKPAPETAE